MSKTALESSLISKGAYYINSGISRRKTIQNKLSRPIFKRVVRRKNGTIKELTVPEKAIQAHILAYLQQNGYLVWRNNSGGTYTKTGGFIQLAPKGSPDIVGMTKTGQFLGIEVKNSSRVQNVFQIEFQRRIIDQKGIYILARSVNDVVKELEKI